MKPETSNELRGLVREVLKEAMANRAAPKQGRSCPHWYRRELQALSTSTISVNPFAPGNCASLGRPHLLQHGGLEGVISEQKISALAAKENTLIWVTAVLTPLAATGPK
jgi:hypothetical protein